MPLLAEEAIVGLGWLPVVNFCHPRIFFRVLFGCVNQFAICSTPLFHLAKLVGAKWSAFGLVPSFLLGTGTVSLQCLPPLGYAQKESNLQLAG